ncbi:MAG: ketopantoate reductase family protein [bacterium]|nr:ketopantoate reductase family protein [bacterium]MCP5069337.1 ketopantoate reductase family protein [bacterium]
MDVIVFGAGAVGLGLASALLEAGEDVALIARPATAAALANIGLRRSGIFGEIEHPPDRFQVATSPAELPARKPDFVLVATKSFDSQATAESLVSSGWIGRESRIVLCQNGWGNAGCFTAHFPERQVWNARVITGFQRPEPHHVEITVHAEPIHIGSLYGEPSSLVSTLCAAIDRGGLPCEPTDRIARDLWAKLLYNGLLNPLGAIFEVPYGEIGKSEAAREILRNLAREIFAVMHASGHSTHWPDADAYLEHFFSVLLPPTAAHESSTLQDLRAGRRTEIDALTGAIVSLGEECGLPVPVNRTLLGVVKFIEASRRSNPT